MNKSKKWKTLVFRNKRFFKKNKILKFENCKIFKYSNIEFKKAGFWVKLLSRIIDIIPIAVISVAIAFLVMKHSHLNGSVDNIWHFENPWEFYIWGIMLMTLILIQFIIIPFISKGQTIGQCVMQIKVITTENSIRKAILKREVFFSLAWLLCSFLVIVIINHTLITRFASTKSHSGNFQKYTSFESLRIGIVSTVGSITTVIQFIIGISVLVRHDKKGLHDVYAKTSVVYVKRFIELPKDEIKMFRKAKPQPYKNVLVEWIK